MHSAFNNEKRVRGTEAGLQGQGVVMQRGITRERARMEEESEKEMALNRM